MRAQQLTRKPGQCWSADADPLYDAQLVLYFGNRAALEDASCHHELKYLFPAAHIVGCSTGGQMLDNGVTDEIATGLALRFSSTDVFVAQECIADAEDSYRAGRLLGVALFGPELTSVLVISDGLAVNGSDLVAGIKSVLGHDIVITGGLAGDGADFNRTLVASNDIPKPGQVAAIGLYGSKLVIGHGSAGGWSEFGPKRRITKSAGNVLAELDGKPALDLYKLYLGDEAEGLPGTGLLYPLLISDPKFTGHSLVRTILAVDDNAATLTFAGDVPEGWTAQLMRGYSDRLVNGASEAARSSVAGMSPCHEETVAIVVSCIGRRLLMGENVVDEIEAANRQLGKGTHSVGFYSYGEISPHPVTGVCELHNQTMTVTTIAEAA